MHLKARSPGRRMVNRSWGPDQKGVPPRPSSLPAPPDRCNSCRRSSTPKYESALKKYQLHSNDTSKWSWSPAFPELIGHEVTRLGASEDDCLRAQLHYSDLFSAVDPRSDFIPSLLSGYIEPAGETPVDLAVGINGQIWTTTQTYDFPVAGRQRGTWEALVPESAFTAGKNLVEVFAIRGDDKDPILSRVYSSQFEQTPTNNLILEVARWRRGVEFSGFYPQEWWGDHPARWTNGNASFSIPIDPTEPPQGLGAETGAHRAQGDGAEDPR